MAIYNRLLIFAAEKETERREPGVPFFFYKAAMSRENEIEVVRRLLQPLLGEDVFLVDIKIKPINNIKIYLDSDGGLGIEKCIKINRALYKVMEEMDIYPNGDFSLEVSSPGIDEPLKMHRQYVKNTGRDVEVLLNDDVKKTGRLMTVNENDIIIEFTEGKNKKAVLNQLTIPFSNIKQTIVLVKF